MDRLDVTGDSPAISKWETNATSAIEAEASAVAKTGTWTSVAGLQFSGGTAMRSTVVGSELKFAVAGTEAVIYGVKSLNLGSFDVFVDGATKPAATFSSAGPDVIYQSTLGRVSFARGSHTLTIKTKTIDLVEIDRIEVFGSSAAAGTTTATTTTYSYDSLGRRTGAQSSGGASTYTWAGSRLTQLANPGAQDSFVYDGAGQRTEKTTLKAGVAAKTTYIYDGISLLSLTQASSSSTQTLTYLYGSGSTPVGALYQSTAAPADTRTFEIVSDAHGDVREMRDSVGEAFARFDYDVYGNIRSQKILQTSLISQSLAEAIASLQPLRYAGYTWDAETGLYYCSQRYYDPAVAAFISKDPAKADGEQSAYGYCAGDPVNGIDPTGLIFMGTGDSISYYSALNDYYAKLYPAVALWNAQSNANWRERTYNKSNVAHKFSIAPKGSPGLYYCSCCGGYFDSSGKPIKNTSQILTGTKKMGEPNSKETDYYSDGTPQQDRWFDSKGDRERDRDYKNGDVHDHIWVDGARQPDHLPPSPGYQFNSDPSGGQYLKVTVVILIGLAYAALTGDVGPVEQGLAAL